MSLKTLLKNIFNFDVFLGFVSGPIVSTLMMLLPLGVLIGLFEVIDPAFVAYEYVPEEILFIPWILIMIFISFVNMRAAYLLNNLERSTTVYMIQTDKYYTSPENRKEQDEYPGKRLCIAFQSYLTAKIPDLSQTPLYHRDYGWSFLVEEDENSKIEITFAFDGIDDLNPHIEKYEIAIDYSLPLNPFYRASFFPNIHTYQKINNTLLGFLELDGIIPVKE